MAASEHTTLACVVAAVHAQETQTMGAGQGAGHVRGVHHVADPVAVVADHDGAWAAVHRESAEDHREQHVLAGIPFPAVVHRLAPVRIALA